MIINELNFVNAMFLALEVNWFCSHHMFQRMWLQFQLIALAERVVEEEEGCKQYLLSEWLCFYVIPMGWLFLTFSSGYFSVLELIYSFYLSGWKIYFERYVKTIGRKQIGIIVFLHYNIMSWVIQKFIRLLSCWKNTWSYVGFCS